MLAAAYLLYCRFKKDKEQDAGRGGGRVREGLSMICEIKWRAKTKLFIQIMTLMEEGKKGGGGDSDDDKREGEGEGQRDSEGKRERRALIKGRDEERGGGKGRE